jgi:hypothetical protein
MNYQIKVTTTKVETYRVWADSEEEAANCVALGINASDRKEFTFQKLVEVRETDDDNLQ